MSEIKRFILRFSPTKNRELFTFEIEIATVYALAELERGKGGGFVIKQPQEKLEFITQFGYPLWLFPDNEMAFIFDGLNSSSYRFFYSSLPNAKQFMESLDKYSKIRQDYITFLFDHKSYFQNPGKENEVSLKGLIVDLDFKKEFNLYRKEASENSQLGNMAILFPALEEKIISSQLAEIDKLQSAFKVDGLRLPECLKLLNKTTSQYVTELDYAAQAVRDETNAKIKAQEELVNPKIIKLNKEYKHQMSQAAKGFDEDLESLEKLKAKTIKAINNAERNLNLCQRERKSQSEKNHLVYEKRWKEKTSQTKKELGTLKKELNRLTKNIKNISKQKRTETSKLQFELEAEIRSARKPLRDLDAACDTKMLTIKQETEKLLKQEKPVIDGINYAIKLTEIINAKFEMLGIREQQLKTPALFYIPFYIICYKAGTAWRYVFLPPSVTSAISFSAKLKGAFGMSKIKDLFIPRFKAITALIDKCQILVEQETSLENQIRVLGEKTNLLSTDLVPARITKGLIYLKHEGLLSEKEYQALSNSLATA